MVRHRTHSIEFKRQVVQDYLAGKTLHSLGRRHGLSRNLIRIWIQRFEAGAFDDDVQGAVLARAGGRSKTLISIKAQSGRLAYQEANSVAAVPIAFIRLPPAARLVCGARAAG